MPNGVLALSAGSSCIGFTLSEIGESAAFWTMASGEIEGIGTASHLMAHNAAGRTLSKRRWPSVNAPAYQTLFGELLTSVEGHLGIDSLVAMGHRVVNGGSEFTGPVPIPAGVLDALAKPRPLAPFHHPHNRSPIKLVQALRVDLPPVACLDTAFHHAQPAVATRFALPRFYAAELHHHRFYFTRRAEDGTRLHHRCRCAILHTLGEDSRESATGTRSV